MSGLTATRMSRYLGGPGCRWEPSPSRRKAKDRPAAPQCLPQPPGAALCPPSLCLPLLPQSPPPAPSLPLLGSPEPSQTPLRPRPAPPPRLPRPLRRPRAPFPGGHGDAPGLSTLGLGASAPSAAPRGLPAPSGAQRLRSPGAGIPAGGSGLEVLRLGASDSGSCRRKGLGDRSLRSLGSGSRAQTFGCLREEERTAPIPGGSPGTGAGQLDSSILKKGTPESLRAGSGSPRIPGSLICLGGQRSGSSEDRCPKR